MTINQLLSAAPSREVGLALVDWARELSGRIVRGDMMIGILSPDEVALAPKALRKAKECGIDAALLDLGNWLAAPPFGEPDAMAAEVAFREAMAASVPGARLRLVEFVWFFCRDTASDERKREVYLLAEELAETDSREGRALHLLGLMTSAGFGTQADPHSACAMQEKAAEMGDADAMFEAWLHYDMGLGVAKNSAVGLGYLRRAADCGQPRAMYNMAACLATGRGMARDLASAAEWYLRSSEAGNVRATANLAMMYAKGEGVKKDVEHAKMLFDEAEYMGLDVSGARASVGL